MSWSIKKEDVMLMLEQHSLGMAKHNESTFYLLKDFQPRIEGKPMGSPIAQVVAVTEGEITLLRNGKRIEMPLEKIASQISIYTDYKDIKELDPKIVAAVTRLAKGKGSKENYYFGTKDFNATKYQFHTSPHAGMQAYPLFLTVRFEDAEGKHANMMYLYESVVKESNKKPKKKSPKLRVTKTKKIKDLFIEVTTEHKRHDGSTFTMKHMLDTYFQVDSRNRHLDPNKLVELYTKHITKDRIEGFVKKDRLGGTLVDYSFVYIKEKTQFVEGEYYAHEYDEYLASKARKLIWNSGTVEYEVKVLEPGYVTIAGIWDDSCVGASRIASGTGDYFEPYQPGLV